MGNSSAHIGFTEGVGGRLLATYRFQEDGVDKDVERIAPGCGVLLQFTPALGVTALGKAAATEIPCMGKGRIIVKARSLTTGADSCSFYLVYKAYDGSIIGPSLLTYAQFSSILEESKAVATAVAFANDVCASSVYVHVVSLPGPQSVDLFIAAV